VARNKYNCSSLPLQLAALSVLTFHCVTAVVKVVDLIGWTVGSLVILEERISFFLEAESLEMLLIDLTNEAVVLRTEDLSFSRANRLRVVFDVNDVVRNNITLVEVYLILWYFAQTIYTMAVWRVELLAFRRHLFM
jgi:hypothetical protein